MAKKRKKMQKRDVNSAIGFLVGDDLCVSGYTSLDQSPEIMTACRRIAELVGSITIHLMSNESNGDVRIVNELSRKIDIDPSPRMTRKTWMEAIVMNLLLYGNGNSIVLPKTRKGYLQSLEPIAASRVTFVPEGWKDYLVYIDGIPKKPDNLLHFVHNPDKYYPWKGRGLTVSLKEIAQNLKQAAATEKGFMESKWKPSLIVKVDALTDEFSGVEGRKKLREEYLETGEEGAPWIIPADLFDVKEIKPLSLNDLAISDMVQLDKRMVASILGVPPFVVGVGDYNKDAWNNFVQNTVKNICTGIAQEMTKKLILNPKWYLKFNTLSLMDWDLKETADVFGGLSDRGFVTGNEVRDRLGMSPREELDELRILENFIGFEYSNKQKKLIQDGGEQ